MLLFFNHSKTEINLNNIYKLFSYLAKTRGTQYYGWMRLYVTSRKLVGLILDDVIFFFNLPNSSARTMALKFTLYVTEMNTRNFSFV
jgi:hypothetical protein